MENVIEIEALAKEYTGFRLKDVTFGIPKGFITGLVGPNGAGKTTIIKLIMNLIRREGGKIMREGGGQPTPAWIALPSGVCVCARGARARVCVCV